ncbi:MAG: primosomal protein, partial [Planctomycetota bacterium]|jgi:primosomal protein N' (replication factor Y)
VNADTALNLPDFRAAERTFQLVSQVSGRCGRSAEAGRAIVQTFQPDSPAIKLAAAHDYEAFATEELALRERFALPPWRRMARVVIRDGDEEKARMMAEELARALAIEAARINAGEGAGAGAGAGSSSGSGSGPGAGAGVGPGPGAGAGAVEVVGPMPCPIARISDRWRMQVEITAPNAASLGRFLTAARNAKILRPGETYAVDVDPVALM